MVSSAANLDPEERPTRLTGKKDGWSFEIWVKVDDEPLSVYSEAEMDEGGSEAWIASEEGKAYTIGISMRNDDPYPTYPYSEVEAVFSADGTRLGSMVFSGVLAGRQKTYEFQGRRMSAGKIQQILFAKPELTEDDTPGLALKDLATIQVKFSRCQRLETRAWTQEDNAKNWDEQPNGPINEKTKKDAMLGALTKFGDLHPSVIKTICSVQANPEDRKDGFFKMRLHYGPKDFLQARGHIPLKINKDFGVTGLSEDQPIEFNDEDDLNTVGTSRANEQAAVNNEISENARRIAELQAELDALKEEENRKRKAAEEEEETKPQILERMAKKLKAAKEDDGGFVDLTEDD